AGRLLIDEGTGELRRLIVHDLRSGKAVYRALYYGSVTHAGGSRVRYERHLAGPALAECTGSRADCIRERKKAFRALKKSSRPWFDKARLPSCPEPRKGWFVAARFVSSWILDVRTLKKQKGRDVSCTHVSE
ncbi:MAG: hypothetical protein ABI333_19750, partial [bacterium]